MMNREQEKYYYKAFSLEIISDLYFPELLHSEMNQVSQGSITIIQEDIHYLWEIHSSPNSNFVINKEFIMFQIPNKAIFLIKNGNSISYSPLAEKEETLLRLYILGSCMGAILMQRNILPLHGSAIAIGGKAYAIVGDSGAGKSTLAKALLSQGYPLLSDDVIPITFDKYGVVYAGPSYPHQKLWEESLDKFGIDSSPFTSILERLDKFAVPVSDYCTEPLQLGGIFMLSKTDDSEVSIRSINIMERFQMIYHNTYRNFFVPRAGLTEWHFQTTAMLVNKVPMYELQRPTSHFTVYELTDLLLKETQQPAINR